MVRASQFQKGRSLSERETLNATDRCPICGSDAARDRVATLQREPSILLLRCPRCGGCSASRMPRPEVLIQYYSTYYEASGEHAVALHDVPGFARHIVRSAPGLPPSGQQIRILDFGGGDGSLSLAIASRLQRPARITLVDFTQPAAAQTGAVELVSRRDLDAVEGPYDLVLASAILEHIPDLRPVLSRLFRLMAPGAYFYARTPYVLPFLRLVPSFDFTYPGHVHDLGPAFWNRVQETFGVEARLVASRPSRVETSLRQDLLRTLAAHLLKLPTRLEFALRGRPRRLLWPFAGGWEAVLRRPAEAPGPR